MHEPDPQKQMSGRIGGNTRWSKVPQAARAAETLPARQGLEARWLREAEGDPARAANLKALHYARMSAASLKVRRKPRLLKTVPAAAVVPELGEAGDPGAA
jgi:hypothetical protein